MKNNVVTNCISKNEDLRKKKEVLFDINNDIKHVQKLKNRHTGDESNCEINT